MTLDEAIKHAEEVAKKQENNAKSCPKPNKSVKGSGKKYNAYLKCAEEHRQFAEWLKDYKRLLEQEPCEDAISRQAVLEIIRKCNCQGWVKVDIGEPIEALQPVNPAEKVGRWEWVQYDGNPKIGNYHCSVCLCIVEDGKPSYKYCPQCGAKMEGSD